MKIFPDRLYTMFSRKNGAGSGGLRVFLHWRVGGFYGTVAKFMTEN